jgi:ribonucleoside-diphosphate reductase alpha chain
MSHIRSVPSIEAGTPRRTPSAWADEPARLSGAGRHRLRQPEGLDFTNLYFYTITWHALHTSMMLARERGQALCRL